MAVSLRASKEGLQIVDRARRERGWTKAGDDWCKAAQAAPASLKRFWRGVLINRDTFIAICQAIGVDWREIADLPTTEDVENPHPSSLLVTKEGEIEIDGRKFSTSSEATSRQTPYQNLPPREHTAFFGREEEMTRLMELLSYKHPAHLISVDGIGGVGKTTLVLEAAYQCFNAETPIFDAIIFTSAKENYLTAAGLLQRLKRDRTLRDICRAIAATLDRRDITHAEPEDQLERTRECLARLRTLLIVDNLETIEEKEEVLSFLYDLPPTVKVIITTREQALFVPIRLLSLPEADAIQLIEYQSLEKGVSFSQEESNQLYQVTSGVPAAIVYAIGQLASGYLLKDVLERVTQASGDVARFLFHSSVQPLRGQPTHQVLMALAMFPKSASREAIASVALPEADPIATADGLARLQQLSLVKQRQGRYDMFPLTRGYALAELARCQDFEREARERWISWYRRFSQQSGRDWKEWQLEYGNLEQEWENLQAVLEWCIGQARYADFRDFWPQVKGYIHVRGYWDDRLTWTNWLIQAAEERGDLATVAEAKLDRGKTLTLMGQRKQLQEADALLKSAWKLRKYQDLIFQFDLATSITVLRIRQQKFHEALEWLDRQKNLLAQTQVDEQKRCSFYVHIFYYEAEICFKTGNYQQAKALYLQALSQAKALGWQRSIVYTQHWLADVAIALGDLDEAQHLLEKGLEVSERNQDKRCTACYQRSFANLEKLRGNQAESRRWAELALSGFDSLAMIPEAEEMQEFLQEE